MRSAKALTVAGTVRTSSFGLRNVVVLIVAGVVVVWAGIAFAQEAYVSHHLSQQVGDLRRQNAEIAAQNAGYRKDVQALSSGTADEEEARQSGYAKPNEKLYLVTTPPTPAPSPSASASPKSH